jgi:hypothetical protein
VNLQLIIQPLCGQEWPLFLEQEVAQCYFCIAFFLGSCWHLLDVTRGESDAVRMTFTEIA